MVAVPAPRVAGRGETHSPARQAILRAHAEARAAEIAQNPHVQFVWLSGSVAKGLVDAASDLDLHVVVAGSQLALPPWRFGFALENLHQVSFDELSAGLSAHSEAAEAAWMARTCLADVLHGALCLYARPDMRPVRDAIETLVARRTTPRYRLEVARRFAGAAHRMVDKAGQALRAGAPLDAHQQLRHATQELLVAHLIARGWILRGTKKRPEIADAYGLPAEAPDFMTLFGKINGLSALEPASARHLCEDRHRYRTRFGAHLRALARAAGNPESARAAITNYDDHNRHAEDYYRPLLDAGIFRGPINHIRAFSGFARLPALALTVAGRSTRFPISAWLGNSIDGCDIKADWRRVADLCPSSTAVAAMVGATERASKVAMSGAFGV